MRHTIHKITILLFICSTMNSISQTYLQQMGSAINGEAANDRSGKSISSSNDGKTVAIGAYFNDGNGSNSGHVRVYEWNSTSWAQKGLDINGEAIDDLSGFSVSLSADGNNVAIGAPNNDGSGLNAGQVRVYKWISNAWVLLGSDINGVAAGDGFGNSVSLSDDGLNLAVGGIGDAPDPGYARVFSWNGSSWIPKGVILNGESADDWFGESVSLNADGSILAVGAPMNDGNGTTSGHARVFSWNGSAWIQLGSDIDGLTANSFCGKSVQLNNIGNRLIVGSPYYSPSGQVRVFEWNGISWTQVGTDIAGEDANEQFGISAAISGDGNTILAGAFGNSDAGSLAGSARVYSWNGTAWVQLGNDLDGVSANDQCGLAVSISGNSKVISVASYLNSTNGASSGHIRNWNVCQVSNSFDIQTACESFTWINGTTYTSDNNTATFSFPGASSSGCDSIVTLNLTIIPSSQSTDVVSSCGSFTWINGTTYTSDNNTATYTLQNGAVSGCDSIINLNLTILPIAQSTDEIVSCSPITWIDGNTYVSNNNIASYTYTGGATNGCDSVVTLDLTINSVTNMSTTLSGSSNIISSDNASANYIWLDCNNNFSVIPGQTSQTFTPVSNGNYAVQLTENGCVDTSDCVLITTVGIFESKVEKMFQIFPNPTNGNFSIDLGKSMDNVNIQILDLQGRTMYNQNYNDVKILDITFKEPMGIYFLAISNDQELEVIKLVKN
jgi:hypothetical protein